MILMAVMMLIALALASTPAWNANFSCPAQCLFEERSRDMSLTYPYFVAIVLHYSTSIWRVFDTPRFDRFLLQYPRDELRRIIRSAKRTNSNSSSVSNRSFISLRTAVATKLLSKWLAAFAIRFYLAIAAVLGSLTISLYYDILWFTLGLVGILETRQVPGKNLDGDENKLSFGQIVPMLLLASIILTFKEVYTGEILP